MQRETCVHNTKSVVVMNGVCESMSAAILGPAFFASDLFASKASVLLTLK